ncbi:MAG: YeiH family protein [Thermoanaerobaculia bacterium]
MSPVVIRVVWIAGALWCLTPWGTPPLALAVGIAVALLLPEPLPARARGLSRPLLQVSVVLLGFGMDLSTVLRAGAAGMAFAAATIAVTLLIGRLSGKWLGVAEKPSLLISSGTAICGGSAIAAVSAVIGAGEEEISVAMGTVFVLNGAALYLFPALGRILGLSQQQFGTWAGISIHDISSVVGASSVYGLEALGRATAVKLARTLWIVPLSLGAALLWRRRGSQPSEGKSPRATVPWFIGFFLLASLLRSFWAPLAAAGPWIGRVARAGFTLTLFLIGASLSRKSLAKVGWKPLAQGLLLWALIAGGSLAVILRFGTRSL